VNVTRSDAALSAGEAEVLVRDALDSGRLERGVAKRLGHNLRSEGVLDVLIDGAEESKRSSKGDVVTVSRNIFIPLTNLCRNRCSYCTFAKQPDEDGAHTYTLGEVAEVVKGGVRAGCTEALMCLGDKPEIAYKSYREGLAREGWDSTTDLLVEACRVAFENGMLPHTNAGILTPDEMERLRPWNASMGLMLETTSVRLRGKGMPHYHAPDKEPARRIRMHEQAGELKIPFTSGILLGIGENIGERVDTLLTIRDIDDRYGHIQETIVQPFHPKPGTPMAGVSPIEDDEVVGWVALARLILGPAMNVQAPPNLAPEMLGRLVRAGLNDWGGVSPLTIDFINPEAPWPAIERLDELSRSGGQVLRDRGPVYPEWILDRPDYFDARIRASFSRYATDDGFARRPTCQSKEEAA
jgi:FO synthase